MIFVTSFAAMGSLIDPRVIEVVPSKPVSGLGDGTTSPSSTFILLRVSRKMTLTVAARCDENSRDLEICYHEIDHERVTVGLIDPAGLFFIEGDRSFQEVARRGPG